MYSVPPARAWWPAVGARLARTLRRMNAVGRYTLLLLACAFAAGCDPFCENEQVSSVSSPDGSKKAVTFLRRCGATTGDSTQLSIISSWRSIPSGAGNVLVVEGRPAIQVSWASDSAIVVSKIGSGRIFKQEGELDGTFVRYEYAP